MSYGVQYGDVWRLGRHRLACADSLDKRNVEEFIGGADVQLVFTDPPYNMDFSGGGCFQESTNNVRKRIAKIIDFDANSIAFYKELNVPAMFIFTSKALIRDYLNLFAGYNFNLLAWCKTNPTPFTHGSFLPDMEYLLFFSKPGAKIWNNSLKPMSIYSRYYVSPKEEGRREAGNLHPTMKPLKLLEDKIIVSTHEGGFVFDGFGGSGSTLIACEKTGRICYMMEHEPGYCETIIERWEKMTGGKVERF